MTKCRHIMIYLKLFHVSCRKKAPIKKSHKQMQESHKQSFAKCNFLRFLKKQYYARHNGLKSILMEQFSIPPISWTINYFGNLLFTLVITWKNISCKPRGVKIFAFRIVFNLLFNILHIFFNTYRDYFRLFLKHLNGNVFAYLLNINYSWKLIFRNMNVPRDHPYITSSHFWDFLIPLPPYVSMFLVLRISKNWHFLTPLPPTSADVIYEWSPK